MLPRREFLRGLSALGVFSLAGCSDDGEGTDTLTETTRPGTTTVPFTVTETLHDPSTATTTHQPETRTTALTTTPATETETSTDMVVAQSDPDTDSQTSTATQSTTTTTTSPTDTMTDQVFWQDGDSASPTNLSQLRAQTNSSDYVERGLSFTPDYTNNELDITTGHAVIYDESTDRAYDVFPDARTNLALTDTATNYVYLMCDPDTETGSGVDDDVGYHIDTDDTPPTAMETSATTISVKVGEVDTSADTELELQRAPSIDADELVGIADHIITPAGVSDLGAALDSHIASDTTIVVAKGEYDNSTTPEIDSTHSNVTLVFQPGTTITNQATGVHVVDVRGGSNVNLVGYGVTIDGNGGTYSTHGIQAVQGATSVVVEGFTIKNCTGGSNHAMHTASVGTENIVTRDLTITNCVRGIEDEDGATAVAHYNADVVDAAIFPHSHGGTGVVKDIRHVNCSFDGDASNGDYIQIGQGDGVENIRFVDCEIDGEIQFSGPITDVQFRGCIQKVKSAGYGVTWELDGDGDIVDPRFISHSVTSQSDSYAFERTTGSTYTVDRPEWIAPRINYTADGRPVLSAGFGGTKVRGGFVAGKPGPSESGIKVGAESVVRDVKVNVDYPYSNYAINAAGADVDVAAVETVVDEANGGVHISTGTRTRVHGTVELGAAPSATNYGPKDAGITLIDTSSTADPYDRYDVLQDGTLDGPY